MGEKVFGVLKKDTLKERKAGNWTGSYLVKSIDLVPVVTVKWLEKECEKQDRWAVAGSALRELLLAAKKQAEAVR